MNEPEKLGKERRGFFRVDDEMELDYRRFDQTANPERDWTNINEAYYFKDRETAQFKLVSAMHALDQESSHILRAITRDDRELGQYLTILNRKMDLLAKLLVISEEKPLQKVNISGGGLAFACAEKLSVGTVLELKIILHPSFQGIVTRGEVVNCRENSVVETEHPFYAAIKFTDISEHDQQFITQHVMQKQSKELRKKSIDE